MHTCREVHYVTMSGRILVDVLASQSWMALQHGPIVIPNILFSLPSIYVLRYRTNDVATNKSVSYIYIYTWNKSETSCCWLAGGFKDFLFSSYYSQFDEHIFKWVEITFQLSLFLLTLPFDRSAIRIWLTYRPTDTAYFPATSSRNLNQHRCWIEYPQFFWVMKIDPR